MRTWILRRRRARGARGVRVILATHREQIDDRERIRLFGIELEGVDVLA